MRAVRTGLALSVAAAVALAGCGSGGDSPGDSSSSGGGSSLAFSAEDVTALGGQANVDYMVGLYNQAIAAGQKTITVYGITATSSAALYEAFSKRFPGIKVEHVTIFGLELQNRIASEQTTGQHVADNVSVSNADAAFVKDNNYLAEQQPPLAAQLPAEYKPAGNTMFGANEYLYTVSYNTDLVSESEVPKTFDDLLDPKWSGQIALGDVLTGAPGFVNDAIRAGKITPDWLTKFAANKPVIVPSERDTFTAVSTGQVKLGLNNYIRGDAFLSKDNLPVKFVASFKDGISQGVYYRATVKDAPNAIASNLLVAWWLTPEAMKLLSIQGQQGLMPDAPPIVGQPPLSDLTINPAPPLDQYNAETATGVKLFTSVFG